MQISSPILSEQIGQVANLIGLLLALITLFTSDRSDRLREQRSAGGGPKRGHIKEILATAVGLAVVTAAATASLTSLAHKAGLAVWHGTSDPVVSVFLLVWLLLIALLAWQVVIVVSAIRLSRASI
jgi:hypothetical protein